MESALTKRLVRRLADAVPVDWDFIDLGEFAQGTQDAFAIDRFFALARREIAPEVGEIDAALAIRRSRGDFLGMRKRAMPVSVMR